jgi:N-formylglutamate deformylase
VEGKVNAAHEWLAVHHGDAPLVVTFPHSGTEIPADLEPRFVSPWIARKDADHWIDVLYDFAHGMGATTIRTSISRSVIDVNRDPLGASLYPGQFTTSLCPTETFDGEPLYRDGGIPDESDTAARRANYFDPYHAAVEHALAAARGRNGRVVLYDAHSIRSRVPKLFDGELPQFNLGTNGGATCDAALTSAIQRICLASRLSSVTDGRFRGGWTTRVYGKPALGVHAIQMELAMRGYLEEPATLDDRNWPAPLDDMRAARLRVALRDILDACVAFAHGKPL